MRIEKPKNSKKYRVDCHRDHRGKRRKFPGFTDKGATEQLRGKLEELLARRINGDPLTLVISDWLQSLRQADLNRLRRWDWLHPSWSVTTAPLDDLIERFEKSHQNKQNDSKHIRQVVSHIRKIVTRNKYMRFDEIKLLEVQEAIADISRDDGTGAQTRNHYRSDIRQFCNWMVKNKLAPTSPVAGIDMEDVNKDRRYVRRPYSVEELRWLFSSTLEAGVNERVSGSERVVIYLVAAETGLRASELHKLRRGNFCLDAEPPYLVAKKGNTKNKEEHEFPIRDETVKLLRNHLADKNPGDRALNIPKSDHTRRMLLKDLAFARGRWIAAAETADEQEKREASDFLAATDHRGYEADFHSLRNSFIRSLSDANVPVIATQQLARHSTPTLTAKYCGKARREEAFKAIDKLPDLLNRATPRDQATDDATENWGAIWGTAPAEQRTQMHLGGDLGGAHDDDKQNPKASQGVDKQQVKTDGPGFEPGVPARVQQFSRLPPSSTRPPIPHYYQAISTLLVDRALRS